MFEMVKTFKDGSESTEIFTMQQAEDAFRRLEWYASRGVSVKIIYKEDTHAID